MNGIIILDKESGVFSRTAGRKIANLFGEKKFGHIGTLDPMASGVLPIVIGKATKMIPFIEEFCGNKKEYLFGLRFGQETDTLDITGNITKEKDFTNINVTDIINACKSLTGVQNQIPPMFSAIHINGKRAYELARQGQELELQPRKITIFELDFLGEQGGEYNFRVVCSRGTYVRSIVRDIAKICKNIATTTYIRRTLTNGFSIKNAVKLDFLENLLHNNNDISQFLMSSDWALGDIPVINLETNQAVFYKNGGFVKTDECDGIKRVYVDNEFVGIGDVFNGLIHPRRTL